MSTPDATRTGHLYAVAFSSGTVKVGQSIDVTRRIATHAAAAAIHDVAVDRIWISEPVDQLDARERELLKYCSAHWQLAAGGEYFRRANLDQIIQQANRSGVATRELSGRPASPPPNEGTSWMRHFEGHPSEAAEVRAWVGRRVPHADAPLVAHELFVAVLESGSNPVEMTLSTAGDRLRITATGHDPLPLRHSHGPGWRIVDGLSRTSGVTVDERGLWAQLTETP